MKEQKSPNFVNPSTNSPSKTWHDFRSKVVQKLKLSKNNFIKKCASKLGLYSNPKLVFFIAKKIRMIRMISTLFDDQSEDGFTKYSGLI